MPVIDVLMFAEQKEGTESFIATWLKHPGDPVSAYEPIVEISTDKVSMEVPAPSAGVLAEIPLLPDRYVTSSEPFSTLAFGSSKLPLDAYSLRSATVLSLDSCTLG